MADYLLQEDGASKILLEDGSGALLLEGTGTLPFIGSVTTVYAPAVTDLYTADVLADSPLFYWKLGDAVGSSTVADASAHGDTGTVHGSVTFGEPSLLAGHSSDMAARFGGTSSDYISGGDWDVTGSAITLEAWVKPAAAITASAHFIAKFSGFTDVQGAIGVDVSGVAALEINVAGTYYLLLGRTVLSPGSVYHIVGLYDGSNIRLYVNGIEDCDPVAASGSLATNNLDWYVGGNPPQTPETPFDGWLDEIAVYPSALSADRVWRHYEDGAGFVGVGLPFISSHTAVYAPSLPAEATVPFIPSVTAVYAPSLPEVNVPFIASRTRVYEIFSTFLPDWTGVGPGNGGETFKIRLAPNGVTETATLAANIAADDLLIHLTGDGGFPAGEPFVATVDGEVIYMIALGGGSYSVRRRGASNTTPASHAAGASVEWGDSYDQPIAATDNIDASFTADINSTGSVIYHGWLICIDSSQAYLGSDRYATHVETVLGVFDAGAGSSGSNRLDSAQPNAVATPYGVTDSCPVGLSNPALITTDIAPGDVALVRYTNPEAVVLDLGPRSAALDSWFGLKRVDSSDVDVTLSDPTGYVVDTIPSGAGPGPFTGSVEHEWPNPVPEVIGIAPDASDDAGVAVPTPNPVPWTTVTLPGSDRYFTDGIHYSEKGWPMCALAVRQGNRRIPLWQSWDWHDYGFVYSGYGTDDTFCQLLVNRNGVVDGLAPVVDLPGPQDIDGPDAVWDDGTYFISAAWYVAIFAAPYIVHGPIIGGGGGAGSGGGGDSGGGLPGVTFPPGGPPIIIPPPPVEGGDGGGIVPPIGGLFAWNLNG